MTDPRFADSVHGIDYLIDHYSILDIAEDATPKQIKQAYRTLMKDYHPDKVANAALEFQRTAERKSNLIRLAYETLRDEDKRQEYNNLKSTFHPQQLSKDGNPIITIGLQRINVDFLVRGDDFTEREEDIKQAKNMSGYNSPAFSIIEQQFLGTDKPSGELKEAYRSMLVKRNIYLTLLEDFEWAQAGVYNPDNTALLISPESHVEQRKLQMDDVRTKIGSTIDKRVQAISDGVAPKLLTAFETDEAEPNNPVELREKLNAAALETFNARTKPLEDLAEQRAEVFDKLLQLLDWNYFPQEQKRYDKLSVIIEKEGKVLTEFEFECQENNIEMTSASMKYKDIAIDKFPKKEIQAMVDSKTNVVVASFEPELDIVMQAVYVAHQHFEEEES